MVCGGYGLSITKVMASRRIYRVCEISLLCVLAFLVVELFTNNCSTTNVSTCSCQTKVGNSGEEHLEVPRSAVSPDHKEAMWADSGESIDQDAQSVTPQPVKKSPIPDKYNPAWWKNHTQSVCIALNMSTDPKGLNHTPVAGNVVVDEKHKLINCQIAKVASSHLGKIFAILTGLVNTKNPNDISSWVVHNDYNGHFKHFNDLPFQDRLAKLKTYYSFVIVREPFERLLSAYRNKLLVPPKAFQNLSYKIAKYYRTNHTITGNPTFTEFVRYLADPASPVISNNHWMPFYKVCHPCQMNYDFVGKLESFGEDLEHIFQANNLTGLVELPPKEDSHSLKRTDLLLGSYYSQVPKDLLEKLYKVYYPDYALFNYTLPNVIKALME